MFVKETPDRKKNCTNFDSAIFLNKSLSEYKDDFPDELGTLKGAQVYIFVNPNVKLKYICARPVPDNITDKIE